AVRDTDHPGMGGAEVLESEWNPACGLALTRKRRRRDPDMIPRSIKRNLAGLRRRERFIRLVWGAGRWVAVVLVLLLVCMLIDYVIDRDRDTPWSVRYALAGGQLA